MLMVVDFTWILHELFIHDIFSTEDEDNVYSEEIDEWINTYLLLFNTQKMKILEIFVEFLFQSIVFGK